MPMHFGRIMRPAQSRRFGRYENQMIRLASPRCDGSDPVTVLISVAVLARDPRIADMAQAFRMPPIARLRH